MAITLADVLINIDGDSSPLKPLFNKVEKETKGWTNRLSGIATRGVSGLQKAIKVGLVGAVGVGVLGLGALGLAFKDSISLAKTQRDAERQLNAVIESTGGAAGLTADQIKEMASGLQNVTNFGDEAIISGQNLLLTFTNIGGDVFPRATETMLDMSQALGQDMKSSAVQLGKALNDPIQGITALSRVGVSFTEEQKEQIRAMVEAGDVAGAQTLILDELAKEFGGSARAMADPAVQLQNAWGDFKEVIGLAVLPILDRLAQRAMPLVTNAIEKAGPILDGVVSAFTVFTDTVAGGKDVMTAATALVRRLLMTFGVGADRAKELTAAFFNTVTGIQGFIEQARQMLAPIVEAIGGFVEWQDVLIAAGAVVASIVIPALLSIVATAAPVLAVAALLVGGIALVRKAWTEDWGGIQAKVQQATAFISNVIRTGFTALRQFWDQNGEAILAKARQIWRTIQTTIQTILNFIWNGIIVPAVTGIRDFWAAHGDEILAKAETVWNAIQAAVEFATEQISTVVAAFRAAFEGDWSKFGELLREAWDNAWEAITDLLRGLWDVIRPILSELIQNALDKFNNTDWGAVGRGIIDGIAKGIRNGIGAIKDAARSAAEAALDAALGFLGIDSPSRVAADRVGGPFAQGIGMGFMEQMREVRRQMRLELGGMLQQMQPAALAGPGSEGQAVTIYGGLQAYGVQSPSGLLEELHDLSTV